MSFRTLPVPPEMLPSVQGEDTPPVPAPKTIAEAVAQMHQASRHMDHTITRLEKLFRLFETTPEMRTIVINPNASAAGPFVAQDRTAWTAKSVGILNPSDYAVSVGIAGVSTASNSRAPQCPPQAAMVLPVEASDLEFGCDSSLGANSLVVYVFRYVTVQPLLLGDMT